MRLAHTQYKTRYRGTLVLYSALTKRTHGKAMNRLRRIGGPPVMEGEGTTQSAAAADDNELSKATNRLTFYVDCYWIAIWANVVLYVCYVFWALTASPYVHTYLLPAGQPGTLTSQWWSGDFFATGSLAALIVLLMSSAWLAAHPLERRAILSHLIILGVGFLYYLAILCFVFSYPLARANVPSAENAANPANDARWCCVNYNLGGCPNSPNVHAVPALAGYGCNPGLSQVDLIPSGTYIFKLVGLVLALVFMLIDGLYVGFIWRGAVQDVDRALGKGIPATPDASASAGQTTVTVTTTQQQEQTQLGIRSALRSAGASSVRPMLQAPRATAASQIVPAPVASQAGGHGRVPKLSVRIK